MMLLLVAQLFVIMLAHFVDAEQLVVAEHQPTTNVPGCEIYIPLARSIISENFEDKGYSGVAISASADFMPLKDGMFSHRELDDNNPACSAICPNQTPVWCWIISAGLCGYPGRRKLLDDSQLLLSPTAKDECDSKRIALLSALSKISHAIPSDDPCSKFFEGVWGARCVYMIEDDSPVTTTDNTFI